MKVNLTKNLKLFTILIFGLIIASCTENNFDSTNKSVEKVVDEMRQTKIINKNNAIFADIQYDKKTGNILKYCILEKEFDLITLPFESETIVQTRVDKWKVSCSKSVYKDKDGKSSSETECDGKFSCGSAIKKCLDAGGCTEICKATLIWVPESEFSIAELMIALEE
jgi:hypothetical protein